MTIFINLLLILFILIWLAVGLWIFIKYGVSLSPPQKNENETAGSLSLNFTQMFLVWFGFLTLALHFLFK